MKVSELSSSEYLPFYRKYINRAETKNLLEGLENGFDNTVSFFESIPEDKMEFKYAEEKWSIKEIIQHLIDAQRVFSYRALRFARKNKSALSGYEENDFTKASLAHVRSKSSLVNEYKFVSSSTLLLFKSFTNDMLKSIGIASNCNMSVRAIGFIITGHEAHHCKIIKERYL